VTLWRDAFKALRSKDWRVTTKIHVHKKIYVMDWVNVWEWLKHAKNGLATKKESVTLQVVNVNTPLIIDKVVLWRIKVIYALSGNVLRVSVQLKIESVPKMIIHVKLEYVSQQQENVCM
jgi:hypothetical protein